MENNQLNELKKERPTVEEQIAFVQGITDNLYNHLEKMKKENPDVVEWIKNRNNFVSKL